MKDVTPHLALMADLGWHLQLWIDTRDLPDLWPALKDLPVPVVVDHMGRMEYHLSLIHISADAPHGDDVRLLREQATRCRDILAKITELSSSGEPFDRTPLSALIEEVVAPHRNFGVAIDVTAPGNREAEPVGARNPAILYGLGNLVENAVDFARGRVEIGAQWSADAIDVTISDDGPGFAPDILCLLYTSRCV